MVIGQGIAYLAGEISLVGGQSSQLLDKPKKFLDPLLIRLGEASP